MVRRKVKCKATGEYGYNDTFYRSEKLKAYFKDEETYEKYMLEKSIKKVKCKITGEEGTSNTFYKVTTFNQDGQPTTCFYKSKEVYDEWRAKTDKRLDLNRIIGEFMGYFEDQPFPTTVTKKVKELEKTYDIFTIYDTFVECRDKIQWAMDTMEFNSEIHKCNYMMAIIVNNINDVYKRRKKEERESKRIENIPMEDYTDIVNNAEKKGKNISRFLSEDELWN